jgi:hypothetical protein
MYQATRMSVAELAEGVAGDDGGHDAEVRGAVYGVGACFGFGGEEDLDGARLVGSGRVDGVHVRRCSHAESVSHLRPYDAT